MAYDVLEEAILQSENFPKVRTEINNLIKQKKDLYSENNTPLFDALDSLLDELVVFVNYKPTEEATSRSIKNETLYYPYSDCEDRAILFSHLIRLLTNRDVVLLYYPNHLATAVHFTRDMPGDYVMVDGKKYLVCDPTGYKPIGNAYDEFKNVEAKVIKIK